MTERKHPLCVFSTNLGRMYTVERVSLAGLQVPFWPGNIPKSRAMRSTLLDYIIIHVYTIVRVSRFELACFQFRNHS